MRSSSAKVIFANGAAISLSLFCVFFSVSPAVAQPAKPPTPSELRRRIEANLVSELYIAINYYINGRQPPSAYDGPREGGPRDPKRLYKGIKEYIPMQDEYISEEPLIASLYEDRGMSYLQLYEVTENLSERAAYAEKALTDFNKAMQLDPNSVSTLLSRARLFKLVDFFAYFDVIVADQLESIRLMRKSCAEKPRLADDCKTGIPNLYLTISAHYWNRGRILSEHRELLEEIRRLHRRYLKYSLWDDFDTAIEYALKNATKPNEARIIVNYYMDKGDAAYRLGKYKRALEAYHSAKRYFDAKLAFYCEASPNICEAERKYAESIFSKKIADANLKLKK
ncbi:MAG TPA: hypothetical protein VK400_18115 [Pyrinomonadaceae bacterium]|nr:hypothetical protein [Pyrinomonadaceae bacterium]